MPITLDNLVEEERKTSEKESPYFSMEDYLEFAEKFPNKPKLAKDWVAIFLLYDKILNEKRKEEQEQKDNFPRFSVPIFDDILQSKKSKYILSPDYFAKALEIYPFEKAKDLKSLFDMDITMLNINKPRPPKWWEYLFRPSVEERWNDYILETYFHPTLSEESRKEIHKEVMAEINEAVQERKRTVYRTLYEKLGYVFESSESR